MKGLVAPANCFAETRLCQFILALLAKTLSQATQAIDGDSVVFAELLL
jgi:hypothetical protein